MEASMFPWDPQAVSAVIILVGRSLFQLLEQCVHDISRAGRGYDSRQASQSAGGQSIGPMTGYFAPSRALFAVQRKWPDFGWLSDCAGASRRESRAAPGRVAPAIRRCSGWHARYDRRVARSHMAIRPAGHTAEPRKI